MLLLVACATPPDAATEGAFLPTLSDPEQIVPGAGLPASVVPQPANNNLAVNDFDGRTFLAWRTAPTHFASTEAEMHVISSADGVTWDDELTVALGTDVREPHLLVWNGQIRLYFAVLGQSELDFEPQGMMTSLRTGPGAWTEPESVYEPTFIPWRMKVVDDVPWLIGYVGGENVYDPTGDPIEVHWLTTEDGLTWTAAVGDDPVVHTGGASETDWVFLDDGSLVAVMRNEAGEGSDFGSFVCTAPADDLGNWDCLSDPRKYDSPLLFRAAGKVWLVGRRNLTDDGLFDLGRDDLDHADQYLDYQVAYWQEPKRCSLWEVDPATRTVTWALDLPSRGDTCFPDRRDLGDVQEIWNYTSPLDGPDLSWIEGQNGPTDIYRIALDFGGG
jgi:hypothetical protein